MRTTIKYLGLMGLSAAMLFGMGSCSKDDASGDTGKTQSLVIKLPNVLTRAVEDQQVAGTSTEIDATLTTRVFLLVGNNISGYEDFDYSTDLRASGELVRQIEDVPGAVNNVLVVANISDVDAYALRTASTLSDVENRPYTILSQSTTGLASKLLMGKTANFAVAPNPTDTHPYKEATVNLAAVTARMEVGTVKPGVGVIKVELVGVWINNFYADGSKANTKTYAYDDAVWNISPAAGVSNDLTDFNGPMAFQTAYNPSQYYDEAQNDKVELKKGSQAYAYHVFAGNIPHLILLVKGQYEPAYKVNGKEYFLKWVTFTNFYENGTPITKMDGNCIYKIGVVPSNATGLEDEDTGIVINADDLTDDPELPMFDLGITVKITPWTSVYVTPGV